MVNIRRERSFKRILKLNERIFPADPLHLKEDAVCWVAWLGDMPVGFATISPLTNEPGSVFFSRAGLLPIARGMGLHARLIKVRIKHCKKNGFKNAITYTLDDNLVSSNNLIACGFKLYEPNYRWADSREKKKVLYFYIEFSV